MMPYILLVIAVGFGIARFFAPVAGLAKEDVFKDMAHLFVGFCFGYAAYARTRRDLWAIPIVLTVVEIAAFLIRKN